jgi:hypothetical protein
MKKTILIICVYFTAMLVGFIAITEFSHYSPMATVILVPTILGIVSFFTIKTIKKTIK